jgi:hypothetical protein
MYAVLDRPAVRQSEWAARSSSPAVEPATPESPANRVHDTDAGSTGPRVSRLRVFVAILLRVMAPWHT